MRYFLYILLCFNLTAKAVSQPTDQWPFSVPESVDTLKTDRYWAVSFPIEISEYQQFHRLDTLDSLYRITMTFADHHSKPLVWSWAYPKYTFDSLNFYYGMPAKWFEKTVYTPEEVELLDASLAKALFMDDGEYIVPDLMAIVQEQYFITEPLFALVEQHLGNEKNFFSELDLILKFCQDMHYEIPPRELNGKFIEGVFPPSMSLLYGRGDCDSKSVLFASILANSNRYKVIACRVPGHLYLGVQGASRPYYKTVSYRGEDYIVCEPVGPGRLPLGTFSRLSRDRTVTKKIPLYLEKLNQVEKVTPRISFHLENLN